MSNQRRRQLPTAMRKLEELFAQVEGGIEDAVREAHKWPCVRTELEEWANSLSTTNCGWSEYQMARRLIEQMQKVDSAYAK